MTKKTGEKDRRRRVVERSEGTPRGLRLEMDQGFKSHL
jgi:hypothetical protein